MYRTILTISIVVAFLSNGAQAQVMPDWAFVDGVIDISRVEGNDEGRTLARTKLDLGYRPTGNNGSYVGFTLGIDAIYLDGDNGGETTWALYPALTMSTSHTGMISGGLPRLVTDKGYIPENTAAGSSAIELATDATFFTPSIASSSHLFAETGDTNISLYGLRYDDKFKNVNVGMAYHNMNTASGNIAVVSIAYDYQLDIPIETANINTFGGYEYLTNTDSSISTTTLGIELNSRNIRSGLIVRRGEPEDRNRTHMVNFYAEYDISEIFSASASIMQLWGSGSGIGGIHSIGVEMHAFSGGYVNLSATNIGLPSKDEQLLELSIGRRF